MDNQDKNCEPTDKLKLPFPVLSDSDHRVIDAYDLYNMEGKIARPALFVIDKSGVVRWIFLNEDYKIRALNNAVLDELRKLK